MRLTILSLCLMLALGACGIKPTKMEPPAGSQNTYPRTYPDPATDPRP